MQNYSIRNRLYEGNIDCHKTLIDISNFSHDDLININSNSIVEVNPFNVLVLSNALRQHQINYGNLIYNRSDESSYLGFMGFYRNCSADNTFNSDNFAFKEGRYISITPINLYTCSGFENDYENIDIEARKMASMLGFDKNLSQYTIYCFTEMMRNVFEHAKTKSVYVCAQHWPQHQLVEIAIADVGCGIREAMSSKYKYNEASLLKLAMFPGISAESNFGWFSGDNAYKNSGYGLYITKELALAYGGSFMICSGHYARHYVGGKIFMRDSYYSGTAISIRFRTDQDTQDFYNVLKIILNKAETLSYKREDAIHKASKSSGGSLI